MKIGQLILSMIVVMISAAATMPVVFLTLVKLSQDPHLPVSEEMLGEVNDTLEIRHQFANIS